MEGKGRQILRDLNDKEKLLLPKLVEVVQNHTKEKMIKGKQLASAVGVTERSLRKMIHYLRVNHILPVISVTVGYYISYEVEDLNHQIAFCYSNADAYQDQAWGLEYFLKHGKEEANQRKLI